MFSKIFKKLNIFKESTENQAAKIIHKLGITINRIKYSFCFSDINFFL